LPAMSSTPSGTECTFACGSNFEENLKQTFLYCIPHKSMLDLWIIFWSSLFLEIVLNCAWHFIWELGQLSY